MQMIIQIIINAARYKIGQCRLNSKKILWSPGHLWPQLVLLVKDGWSNLNSLQHQCLHVLQNDFSEMGTIVSMPFCIQLYYCLHQGATSNCTFHDDDLNPWVSGNAYTWSLERTGPAWQMIYLHNNMAATYGLLLLLDKLVMHFENIRRLPWNGGLLCMQRWLSTWASNKKILTPQASYLLLLLWGKWV